MSEINTYFLNAAIALQAQGRQALVDGKVFDAIPPYEMAFASAFMAGNATLPMTVKLLPSAILPRPMSTKEHVWLQVQRRSVAIYASIDLILSPITELRRFPQVGDLLARVARLLPDDGSFGGVLDLGDGDDLGDYRRMAYSSARADSLLLPDPYFHLHYNYNSVRRYSQNSARPWAERSDALFWRGSAAGYPLLGLDAPWGGLIRPTLCHHARQNPLAEKLDVGLSSLHQIHDNALRDAIQDADLCRPEVRPERFADFRYLLDMDGWSNSWSLLHKLIMGSTMVKLDSMGGFRQWYYDQLRPWQNYIPIARDLSDFDQIIAWIFAHPSECEAVAAQGAALGEAIQLEPALERAAEQIAPFLEPL